MLRADSADSRSLTLARQRRPAVSISWIGLPAWLHSTAMESRALWVRRYSRILQQRKLTRDVMFLLFVPSWAGMNFAFGTALDGPVGVVPLPLVTPLPGLSVWAMAQPMDSDSASANSPTSLSGSWAMRRVLPAPWCSRFSWSQLAGDSLGGVAKPRSHQGI